MAISALTGPLVVFGKGASNDYNNQLGLSAFVVGVMTIDPRHNYAPGASVSAEVYGWLGASDSPVINQIPSAISAVNISAAHVPVAGTPLTLVAASGAGITVGATATNVNTGAKVTGLLAIDGTPGLLPFGQDGTIALYDPTTLISRAVTIHSVGDDSGATFTVSGYDIYGYAMTDTVTGATAGNAATTKKAFKFIKSITPAGVLSGSNVTVGTSDVYGFPLRADSYGQVSIVWAGSNITSNTGFTAADATSPATALTGDTRGTYATQSASDGTKVLQINITLNPNTLSAQSVNNLDGISVATVGVVQA